MLPGFTDEGLLPPGDYELTLDQLRRSMLVVGPGADAYPHWDSSWRATLVDNLAILVNQLRQVGITEIYVDGSFVEDKDHPNDIDGYFHCDLKPFARGDLARNLNLLEPDKIWTWDPNSRRPCAGFTKKLLPMWHKYRVELYPHATGITALTDNHGNSLEFPAAFRRRRSDDKPKGIVKIGGHP